MANDENDVDQMSEGDLALELDRLNAKKLRCEIRDLLLSWWQRPSSLAAVATVAAAVVGLAWAVANGTFETRKRELLLETRDLQDRRDAQSREFEREKNEYSIEISKLVRRSEQLTQDIEKVDIPYIARSGINNAPWEKGTGSVEQPHLWLSGKDFGTAPGKLRVQWVVTAAGIIHPLSDIDPDIHVGLWNPSSIEATIHRPTRDRLLAAIRSEIDNVEAHPSAELGMLVLVVRADGRQSMMLHHLFPEATTWLFDK
jgi:hypothetical protein